MNINVDFQLNLKTEQAQKQVQEAIKLGLRDTIVAIHGDVTSHSPWLTGNNARSITSEVFQMGIVEQGETAEPGGRIVDDEKAEAAVYSTSGYGGFLETGTSKMGARPYFRPALDRNKDKLIPNIKRYLG